MKSLTERPLDKFQEPGFWERKAIEPDQQILTEVQKANLEVIISEDIFRKDIFSVERSSDPEKFYPQLIDGMSDGEIEWLHGLLGNKAVDVGKIVKDQLFKNDRTKYVNNYKTAFGPGLTLLKVLVALDRLDLFSKVAALGHINLDYNQDKQNWPVMHYCCHHNKIEYVKILLKHKASVAIEDAYRDYPYYYAELKNHEELMDDVLAPEMKAWLDANPAKP